MEDELHYINDLCIYRVKNSSHSSLGGGEVPSSYDTFTNITTERYFCSPGNLGAIETVGMLLISVQFS